MNAAINEGDRVTTDQGTGTVVSIWHDLTWSFGIPRRVTFLTVEIDGAPHWRRVYNPGEVDVLDEVVDE